MKLKKSWIFWICYYGIAIMGNVLAAVLLRDKWNFNGWSAFPIVSSLLCIFLAWFAQSGRAEALYLKHRQFEAEWNFFSFSKPSPGELDPFYHHFFVIFLLEAPLFLPAIFFISGETKGFFSIGIIFGGFFAGIIYHIWGHLAREEKDRQLKEKKAREYQERKEEMGKWK